MHRVTHNLTEEQYQRLKTLSDRTGLTVSEWIRRFIDEGLNRQDRKPRKDHP